MHILVLLIAPLGDTLFATPSLKALRNGYPGANIEVIATSRNKQILTGNENIDKLSIINNKSELLKMVISLHDTVFDMVIALSHVGSYISYLFNGRKKMGFKGRDLSWIYNYCPPDDRSIHAVNYNLAIACDAGGIADRNPGMNIPFTGEDYYVLERLGFKKDIPIIAVHPGGKFFSCKRWPIQKFNFLVKEIDNNINVNIVLLGGKNEKELASKVIDINHGYNHLPVNLAGKLSIKETAALLAKAVLFIGNDSAPQHIAAAVGTPVISIFGPTDPANFHPYGTEYKIVSKKMSCSPCFHWLGDFKQYFPQCKPVWLSDFTAPCMENIQVEDIMKEIDFSKIAEEKSVKILI